MSLSKEYIRIFFHMSSSSRAPSDIRKAAHDEFLMFSTVSLPYCYLPSSYVLLSLKLKVLRVFCLDNMLTD